jgi:hypothetical protein
MTSVPVLSAPVVGGMQPAQLPADLILTKLDVTSLGKNKYQVTDTLLDGGPILLALIPRRSGPGGVQNDWMARRLDQRNVVRASVPAEP